MYGLFRAVMHVACSVVKERSFVSVAPYSLTGMFTRPNAIAPLHKARAIVGPPEQFKRRAMRLLTICPPRYPCLRLTCAPRPANVVPIAQSISRRKGNQHRMSGPPAGPPPETPISVPSSGSPPYGALPFPQMYYPAPPPRRDNLALIIVVVCRRGRPRLCGHFGRLVHPGVRFNQGPESSTHRRLRACRDDGREREH